MKNNDAKRKKGFYDYVELASKYGKNVAVAGGGLILGIATKIIADKLNNKGKL
ncbi:hypothetical protein HO984_00200 [Streptococcus suis]|nr:hypothetical protein [Streptococcus suis]HEM2844509.1 hypothetical protein [Streptococcus suis]HEM2848973.1 hypothetical protein [Streptococcus suis]HEM5420896.1 hypothetical protein [Streptococcus suis]